MEKHKFEFQKLELPKQISSSTIPQHPNQQTDDGLTMSVGDTNTPHAQIANKTKFPYGYLILFTIIGLVSGYFTHQWQSSLHQTSKPIIVEKILPKQAINTIVKADSTNKQVNEKPVYFNYYDSFKFLNDVKGSKIVVSKGFDDYIKKEKLIVKANGYYFNLFCKDLYSNYVVGDSIP